MKITFFQVVAIAALVFSVYAVLKPPMLSAPIPNEELFMYLSVSDHPLSSVLIKAEDGIHNPIYYIIHVLYGTKERYTKL